MKILEEEGPISNVCLKKCGKMPIIFPSKDATVEKLENYLNWSNCMQECIETLTKEQKLSNEERNKFESMTPANRAAAKEAALAKGGARKNRISTRRKGRFGKSRKIRR